MATTYLEAAYGGVPLDLAVVDTTGGRSLAITELSRGDLPVVQDRGRATRRVSCEVLFIERDDIAEDPLDRFLAFKAMAEDGTPRLFRHPLDGSFLAAVEQLEYRLDSEAQEVSATCAFVAVGDVVAVTLAGTGGSAVAGAQDVATAAQAVNDELDALGLSSSVPDDCTTAADGWAGAESPNPRRVLLEISSLTQQIAQDIADGGLTTDIDNWAAYRAYTVLEYRLRAAAEAATATTTRIFTELVREPIALRALVARRYGAASAEQRYREVLELNDLRRPGRIPQGTRLKMPLTGDVRR